MPSGTYSQAYFNEISKGSLQSATEVIPVVLQFTSPMSVLDIGCGAGNWLSVWQKYGVNDIWGVDGEYVDASRLLIEKDRFRAANLEKGISLPKKFDLVMSLEVAEHINPGSAGIFIESLCRHADVILFSAAIPGQGGVLHINEQYPGYWADIFRRYGFSAYDCIREKIWLNKKIDTCYRQNLLFFVKDEVKERYPSITAHARTLLPLVHPEHFEKKEEILISYKRVLRTPFHAGWHFVKKFPGLFRSKKNYEH
ncbi:MAG: class I SAM-dependent methyltransferase [Bacteroidota bacterium]